MKNDLRQHAVRFRMDMDFTQPFYWLSRLVIQIKAVEEFMITGAMTKICLGSVHGQTILKHQPYRVFTRKRVVDIFIPI